MFQIIPAIVSFLKELYFNKKEETDFKSPHFRPVKVTLFIVFTFSLIVNYFAITKIVHISLSVVTLNQQISDLVAANRTLTVLCKTVFDTNTNLEKTKQEWIDKNFSP